MGSERSLFIAAIDPNDADKVYIRTSSNTGTPARLLLREKATDGGTHGTTRTLFTSKAPLEGFALSADGSKVWVGSTFDGVYLASTADYQFVQKSKLQAQCLAVNADGLYACSNEQTGFILGLSKDDGATFTPELHFCTIRGPLGCDNSSETTQQCAPIWAAQQDTLGCGDISGDGGLGDGGGAPSRRCPGHRVVERRGPHRRPVEVLVHVRCRHALERLGDPRRRRREPPRRRDRVRAPIPPPPLSGAIGRPRQGHQSWCCHRWSSDPTYPTYPTNRSWPRCRPKTRPS